jgi:hypothetical protein
LSATPNGKDHNDTRLGLPKSSVALCPIGLQPTDLIRGESRGPSSRREPSVRGSPARAGKLSFSEDTSHGTSRPPPDKPSGSRSSRYGHTTRFFTMINQHAPSLPKQGDAAKANRYLPAASQQSPDIRPLSSVC